MTPALRRAKEVLKIESRAVSDQLRHLDASFDRAVNALHAVSRGGGQIVVMGIGKSGIIGRKIAATFSSTGSPSVFFHPAEGLHGDLGMIRARDAVLVLSASGETEEIRRILPVLKERGLLLVAMTSDAKSRLARACDYLIRCAVRKEACPLNLAPTASTTAMLALGDALAMALMEKKGFRADDFAKLHPGGALGKKLFLHVKDVMRTGRNCPQVRSNASVREALLEMTRTRMGATLVAGGRGELAGFFTDGDLRRQLQKDARIMERRVDEVMTKKPATLHPDQTLYEALELIKSRGFDNVPVVDAKRRPVGILDERDLLAEGIV